MTGPETSRPFADVVDEVVARAQQAPRPVLLVDGRAGVGKTTLGGAVAAGLPGAQLIHMDDVYPNWTGLFEGSRHIAEHAFDPATPRWRRWSWDTMDWAEWHELDPSAPLVIEGIGSLSRASAPHATLRVNVTLGDLERKRRALRRDGERFAQWWDVWTAQEDDFLAQENPAGLADLSYNSWVWDPTHP